MVGSVEGKECSVARHRAGMRTQWSAQPSRASANEAVFARIQTIVAGTGQANEAKDPRLAEFELFSSGRELIGENSPRALLHAQTLDRRLWDPERSPDLRGIGSLVAVHRLREVSCAYGFTRFEPSALANDDLEDVGLAVEGAPLGSSPTWLPAVESFGEGFFLTFDPAGFEEWLARHAVLDRAGALERGVSAWERARRQRGLQGRPRQLGRACTSRVCNGS